MVAVLRRIDREFTPHLHEGLAESFYHVVSITMTGKTSYKGNVAPGWVGKIVAATWLVFGVTTVAYLTSSLSSVMTANAMRSRIDGQHDLKGKRVGTLQGSVGERYCALPGIDVVRFPTVDAAAEALAARGVDAVVADAQSLEYFATTHLRAKAGIGVILHQHFMRTRLRRRKFSEDLREPLVVATGEDHACTAARERQRDRSSDALRRSADQRHTTMQ